MTRAAYEICGRCAGGGRFQVEVFEGTIAELKARLAELRSENPGCSVWVARCLPAEDEGPGLREETDARLRGYAR